MLLEGNRIEKWVCLKRINYIIKLDESSCLEKSVNKGKRERDVFEKRKCRSERNFCRRRERTEKEGTAMRVKLEQNKILTLKKVLSPRKRKTKRVWFGLEHVSPNNGTRTINDKEWQGNREGRQASSPVDCLLGGLWGLCMKARMIENWLAEIVLSLLSSLKRSCSRLHSICLLLVKPVPVSRLTFSWMSSSTGGLACKVGNRTLLSERNTDVPLRTRVGFSEGPLSNRLGHYKI